MGYISKINLPDNNTYKILSNFYAVCDTAASTAAKTVTIDDFTLQTGVTIVVKFTNNNTASSPTLQVNSTGAKPIYRYGTTAAASIDNTTGWHAGSMIVLTYDGTGWIMNRGYNYYTDTTYTNEKLGQGYGTCTTAAATTEKAVTLSNYVLTTGGIVVIRFNNAVPANATLNINNKGAKAIYYQGIAITNGIINAGDIGVFIYSTNYYLIAIDKAIKYSTYITSTLPTNASVDDSWFVIDEDIVNINYHLTSFLSSNNASKMKIGSNYKTTLYKSNGDGLNIWDEQWENGRYGNSGEDIEDATRIRTKNFINVMPNTCYYILVPSAVTTQNYVGIKYYNNEGAFLSGENIASNGKSIVTPNNCYLIKFFISSNYGSVYLNDISIIYSFDIDVSVIMNNTNITSTVYNSSTHNINISSITGDVSINALELVEELIEEPPADIH